MTIDELKFDRWYFAIDKYGGGYNYYMYFYIQDNVIHTIYIDEEKDEEYYTRESLASIQELKDEILSNYNLEYTELSNKEMQGFLTGTFEGGGI